MSQPLWAARTASDILSILQVPATSLGTSTIPSVLFDDGGAECCLTPYRTLSKISHTGGCEGHSIWFLYNQTIQWILVPCGLEGEYHLKRRHSHQDRNGPSLRSVRTNVYICSHLFFFPRHKWAHIIPSKCPYSIIANIFPSICYSSVYAKLVSHVSIYCCAHVFKYSGKRELQNVLQHWGRTFHTSVMSAPL